MSKAIKLVTFDATNTLIFVKGSVGQHYARVGALHGIQLSAEKLNEGFRSAYKAVSSQYRNFGSHDGMTAYQWWNLVVWKSFENAGWPSKAVIDKAFPQLYREFGVSTCWSFFDDVPAALQGLKNDGLQLGVISNFHELLKGLLEDLSLAHYFDFILPSVELVEKPNEKIFHRALHLAAVQPSEAVHVGDDLAKDYTGARTAGMHSLLIRRTAADTGVPGVPSDHVIQSLADVRGKLGKV